MIYKSKFQLKKYRLFKNSYAPFHYFKIYSMLLYYSLVKGHSISEVPSVLKYNLIYQNLVIM